MRRGFTLIELLVVVAIMAAMVTVGVVGLNASRASIGTFAAVRDVMAMVRRARSEALLTQKAVVLSYSNETIDGEAAFKVTIVADKLFSTNSGQPAIFNLAGDVVVEAVPATPENEKEGQTVEEILAPDSISSEVAKGLKIKVLDESEALLLDENERKSSKISIFSTADSVLRAHTSAPSTKDETSDDSKADEAQDKMSVSFAANGTVNPPHRIWIYPEESTPEKGLCIYVDRYGEPVCEELDNRR